MAHIKADLLVCVELELATFLNFIPNRANEWPSIEDWNVICHMLINRIVTSVWSVTFYETNET
ncbi:hypothetical protein DERP_012185 [Dermatophagoides pteronyssinus]|uniref:Uncharacterized protein n=1 Tax=Dermatophagoides pteronyssinus TaxID=6956 RepID=A0ABQ8J2I5_DERPT|nr:hypothetical protein DERP_012185 [Dermatophagoides pteronyssinus]